MYFSFGSGCGLFAGLGCDCGYQIAPLEYGMEEKMVAHVIGSHSSVKPTVCQTWLISFLETTYRCTACETKRRPCEYSTVENWRVSIYFER